MKKMGICENCKREIQIHAKGCCFNCYRKYFWKQRLIACKRCGRMMPHQAKGFCAGCYNSLFAIEHVKRDNIRNLYGLNYETYKQITKCCVVCGFDKRINLHHLDKNRANRSSSNLVGLCPNHHMMLHDRRYQEEVLGALKQKGYKIPDVFYKEDAFYKNQPTIKINQPKIKVEPEKIEIPPITIEQIREATKFVDEMLAPNPLLKISQEKPTTEAHMKIILLNPVPLIGR